MAEGCDHQQEEEEETMLGHSPVIWRGLLELRGYQVPLHLHLISGNSSLPPACIPYAGDPPVLRMEKTVKMPQQQLDEITLKTQRYDQHTILIGLPEAKEAAETLEKLLLAQRLKNSFMDFLYTRRCVGFTTLSHIADIGEKFTLYAFPHYHFSTQYLQRLVPKDFLRLTHSAYLLFILTRDSPEKEVETEPETEAETETET